MTLPGAFVHPQQVLVSSMFKFVIVIAKICCGWVCLWNITCIIIYEGFMFSIEVFVSNGLNGISNMSHPLLKEEL